MSEESSTILSVSNDDDRDEPKKNDANQKPDDHSNGAVNGAVNGANNQPQSFWFESFANGLEPEQAEAWKRTASRYKDQTTFAKSYLELRQNAVVIPKDRKPEAMGEIFKRLGRPEKPEEYKWNHIHDAPPLEEGDIAARDSFAPVAHRLGLAQWQLDGVVQWYDQQRKVGYDSTLARARTIQETNDKILKAEWASNYAENVNYAGQAVKAYVAGPDDFEKLRQMRKDDGTFVMDDPVMARIFARIGRERAEDTREINEFNAPARQSAMTEIAKIENDAISKGLYPTHPQWPHNILKPLYERAYGSAAKKRT